MPSYQEFVFKVAGCERGLLLWNYPAHGSAPTNSLTAIFEHEKPDRQFTLCISEPDIVLNRFIDITDDRNDTLKFDQSGE